MQNILTLPNADSIIRFRGKKNPVVSNRFGSVEVSREVANRLCYMDYAEGAGTPRTTGNYSVRDFKRQMREEQAEVKALDRRSGYLFNKHEPMEIVRSLSDDEARQIRALESYTPF